MCMLTQEVYSHPRTIDQGPSTSDEPEILQYLVHSQQQVTEAFREERRGGGLLGRGDIWSAGEFTRTVLSIYELLFINY